MRGAARSRRHGPVSGPYPEAEAECLSSARCDAAAELGHSSAQLLYGHPSTSAGLHARLCQGECSGEDAVDAANLIYSPPYSYLCLCVHESLFLSTTTLSSTWESGEFGSEESSLARWLLSFPSQHCREEPSALGGKVPAEGCRIRTPSLSHVRKVGTVSEVPARQSSPGYTGGKFCRNWRTWSLPSPCASSWRHTSNLVTWLAV